MSTFDGYGWPDKANWDRGGVYETIGPAWALYVNAKTAAPITDESEKAVKALLATQGSSGGFHTHYRPDSPHEADPNIETTALALLGLDAYQQHQASEQAMFYLESQFNI